MLVDWVFSSESNPRRESCWSSLKFLPSMKTIITTAFGVTLSGASLNALDQNLNGIHDLQEFRYQNLSISLSEDDPDFDGRSNLEEAMAFTDPFDPESILKITDIEILGSVVELTWNAEPAVIYQVEYSTDLLTFHDLGVSVTGGGGQSESLEIAMASLPQSEKVFFRVEVTGADFADDDKDGLPNELEEYLGFDGNDSAGSLSELSGGDAAMFEAIMTGANPNGGFAFTDGAGTVSDVQAARFLSQASMGPTEESIEEVRTLGFEAWIDQQMMAETSQLQPYIDYLNSNYANDKLDIANGDKLARDFAYFTNGTAPEVQWQNVETAWMRGACFGDDQLRQRVAWAYSQLFVVSFNNTIFGSFTGGMSNYYDMLLENSFVDYRTILTDVSMHPIMGRYLSHLGNRKGDLTVPRLPDENYAREIMQLFTIGLEMLNDDGSVVLDSDGNPIPTYTNDDITELSKVFTGLWLQGLNFGVGSNTRDQYDRPMVWHGSEHEYGSKSFLGAYIPSFQEDFTINPIKGLDIAIDTLVEHQNCGPFVVRRMIQSLVTSNPSPDYIARCVAVFNEDMDKDGKKDANMGKVIKAILMDEEARGLDWLVNEDYGRIKDPMYRVVSLARAMDAGYLYSNPLPKPEPGNEEEYFEGVQWWKSLPFDEIGQQPMYSPTVFNFYQPDYVRPGILGDQDLFAPELQIVNSVTATTTINFLQGYLTTPFHNTDWGGVQPFEVNISKFGDDAKTTGVLLDRMGLLLAEGWLEPSTRREVEALVNYYPENVPVPIIMETRTNLGLRTVMIAPETVVQR